MISFSRSVPTVYITGIVAQLTALPLGKGLERLRPLASTRSVTFGPPFNINEHVVITVMANVVVGGAFAMVFRRLSRSCIFTEGYEDVEHDGMILM